MRQTFGNFIESFPPDHDSLILSFTPTSERIRHRWRSQRLSAHFVADYLANFFPFNKDDPGEEQQLKEAKGAIGYIANELLENAMKFNVNDGRSKVKLGVHYLEPTAVLFAVNGVNQAGADKFQVFIDKLLSSDPEEMYVQQVEASLENENADMSGLGYLTMINDYHASLGWRFEALQPDADIISVTTMVQLKV
jgi:hypothetical protein